MKELLTQAFALFGAFIFGHIISGFAIVIFLVTKNIKELIIAQQNGTLEERADEWNEMMRAFRPVRWMMTITFLVFFVFFL